MGNHNSIRSHPRHQDSLQTPPNMYYSTIKQTTLPVPRPTRATAVLHGAWHVGSACFIPVLSVTGAWWGGGRRLLRQSSREAVRFPVNLHIAQHNIPDLISHTVRYVSMHRMLMLPNPMQYGNIPDGQLQKTRGTMPRLNETTTQAPEN